MTSDRRAVWILAAAAVLIALPFLNRPYFVDDYYHVTMAKGILDHPFRPYDFLSDDAGKSNIGWAPGERPRMVNPPLFHYYLAAVIRFLGDSEILLRSAMLPFSMLALIAMFFLGKRFSPEPLAASLLMAFTPAYWLTSYSLLIDSMLIAFLLFGLWMVVVAHERRRAMWAAGAGALLGLAMLVKYVGIIGIVLALVWQGINPKRRAWHPGWLVLVFFLLVQLGWGVWTYAAYGQSHFFSTLPRGMTSTGFYLADKFLVTASFLGGGTVFMLAGYALLWQRSRRIMGALGFLLVGGMFLFQSSLGGFSGFQSLQLMIWVGASVSFVVAAFFWGRDQADHDSRFLIAWLGLGLLELLIVMPWTAGRYFLCLLPAACWLLTRLIPPPQWHRWGTGVIAFTGSVGLLVASADFLQANTIRDAAQLLAQNQDSRRKFYLGDTFSGYEPYLKPLGWEAAFPDQEFKNGDLLLIPRYRQSSYWRLPETLRLAPVEAYEFKTPLLVRVMSIPGSAGWYASVWGSLPWVISRDPLERFDLYRVL